MSYRPSNAVPNQSERKRLLRKAQSALFELVLAEPTGSRSAQQEMLETCKGVLGEMRVRLGLAEAVA